MAWSFPVGRVFGIAIRLHVTFVLLLALFASAGLLGWVMMVFGCVLIHELAHSVTAKRHGLQVEEIVLLPIGGVSRIRNLGDDPRLEALVAAVGPLSSLGLAVAAALAATAFGVGLLPPAVSSGGFLARLAWLNLLLAGFNILPAIPMDGGRVLRALLSLRHDPDTATRIAATVSRGLAGAMFVAGLLFDVWLVLIAGFVYL
jgi:Zn-dependent protease